MTTASHPRRRRRRSLRGQRGSAILVVLMLVVVTGILTAVYARRTAVHRAALQSKLIESEARALAAELARSIDCTATFEQAATPGIPLPVAAPSCPATPTVLPPATPLNYFIPRSSSGQPAIGTQVGAVIKSGPWEILTSCSRTQGSLLVWARRYVNASSATLKTDPLTKVVKNWGSLATVIVGSKIKLCQNLFPGGAPTTCAYNEYANGYNPSTFLPICKKLPAAKDCGIGVPRPTTGLPPFGATALGIDLTAPCPPQGYGGSYQVAFRGATTWCREPNPLTGLCTCPSVAFVPLSTAEVSHRCETNGYGITVPGGPPVNAYFKNSIKRFTCLLHTKDVGNWISLATYATSVTMLNQDEKGGASEVYCYQP